MKRIVSTHRLAAAAFTLLVLCAGSWILLKPRAAQAFTLVPANVAFDPISVTTGQTLHLHFVNQFGVVNQIHGVQIRTVSYGIFATCRPTTPGLGGPVTGAPATLNPGDGSDESFPFIAFAPTAGTTRIPVVCTVGVVDASGAALTDDFSGRIASSIEIIDDATGRPTEFNASRHIMLTTKQGNLAPCLFCN